MHLVPDLLRARPKLFEDARGDAVLLAYDAEQDMFGADVFMAEGKRLAERPLRARAWRAGVKDSDRSSPSSP